MRQQRNPEKGAGFLLVEMLVVFLIIGLALGIAAPNVIKIRQASNENAAAMQLFQVSAAEFSMMQLYGIAVPPSQLTGSLGTPNGISCANPMLASGSQTQAPAGYGPMTFTPGAPINSNVTSCATVANGVSTYSINLDPADALEAQAHFYTDQTQVVRFATGRPATSADPVFPIAAPTQGTVSTVLALTTPPATGGSGGTNPNNPPTPPTGNGQPGGQYAVTLLLEGGGSVITTLTGTVTIDPTSGTMSASLAGSGSCTGYGNFVSGSSQDSLILNGCGWGGSQFVGQASYQDSDYNLTFNGAQVGCGNCGQSAVLTGIQQ